MNQNQALSVVVPTLNEEGNVQKLVARIHKTLATAKIPYEIVFIDDHSTDKTVTLVHAIKKRYPFLNLRVQSKRGKRGKAFSLLQGFKAARYPLICMIDADLQYPPEAISAMYNKLNRESADIVVTERVDQKTSRVRQLSTKVFHLVFTRMLFGLPFDSQSGLKLFRKRVLGSIKLNPSQWSFDLEFLVRSRDKNYKIVNHKIAFSERFAGEAKVNVLTTTYELAKASIKLRLQSTSSKHSGRFRLSGQHSVAAGLVFGGASLTLFTPAIGSAISNQSFMLGNIAATSRYRSYNNTAIPAPHSKRPDNHTETSAAIKTNNAEKHSRDKKQKNKPQPTKPITPNEPTEQSRQAAHSHPVQPNPVSLPQPVATATPAATVNQKIAAPPSAQTLPSSAPAQLPIHETKHAENEAPYVTQVTPLVALGYNALNQLGLFSTAMGAGTATLLAIKQFLLK